MVLEKLKEKGFQLQELNIDSSIFEEIAEITVGILVEDGGVNERKKHLKGEKILDNYSQDV